MTGQPPELNIDDPRYFLIEPYNPRLTLPAEYSAEGDYVYLQGKPPPSVERGVLSSCSILPSLLTWEPRTQPTLLNILYIIMDLTDDKTTDKVVSKPVTALRKNGYVVIDERPGQIVEISRSDNEYHIVATDLATGAKLKTSVADDENVDVPDVTRFDRQLLDCENGVITVQLDDGDAKYEVPLPTNEVGDRIKRLFTDEEKDVTVTFIAVMGEEIIVSAKESPQKC